MKGSVITLVAALLFSGCSAPGPSDDGSEPLPHISLPWALVVPILVNETTAESLTYRYSVDPECPLRAIPKFAFRLYDVTGEVLTRTVVIGDEAHGNLSIPLTGEAPFLLVGEANPCVRVDQSRIEGQFSGNQLVPWLGGFDLNRLEVVLWDNFTLEAGERHAEVVLPEPDHAWQMDNFFIDAMKNRVGFQGEINSYYATGDHARKDIFFLDGSHDWDFPAIVWLDGDLRLTITADVAAAQDVRFSAVRSYRTLDENFCQFGFEWPNICATSSLTPPSDES